MAATRPSFRFQPWVMMVALALVMRIFVPQGMMVEQAQGGVIEIAICNSDAVMLLPVKGDKAPAGSEHDGGHCVFAGHGGGDLPPLDSHNIAPPFIAVASFAGFVSAQAAIASTRQLPPARAPPIPA